MRTSPSGIDDGVSTVYPEGVTINQEVTFAKLY
jgi:hypothetical protein